jgi:non-canonical (house-cleaning) NTP pyrophosphatase
MDPEDQYFVFENRLDSFQDPQPVAKGKTSTTAASRAPKALLWPHKTLSPLAVSSQHHILLA